MTDAVVTAVGGNARITIHMANMDTLERVHSSTLKELSAIFLALQLFSLSFNGKTALVYRENAVVKAYHS